jgi:hypothetical protein
VTEPMVKVDGLKQLTRDIKRLSDVDTKVVGKALRDAGRRAAEPVAAAGRSALPRRSGRLSGTVRTRQAQTGYGVVFGNKAKPYAGWVEFGGHREQPHASSREYVRDGRYVFPAAATQHDRSIALYAEAMGDVIDRFAWTGPTE